MLSHILTATYKAIVTLCLPFRVRVRVRVRVSACRGGPGGAAPPPPPPPGRGGGPPAGAVGRLGRGGRPCGC